ncbi:pre-mRNA-splicing factor CWC25 homolog [Anastrepha obliqua]|uniref:pre-mRNA-splicing factor CWC25 homolog n=1 Tax=Anastrepha obliqua TaxID=95512 RepID=UPI0024092DB6|nr:pre-mRNA-splicing factor CWC25 homolog [Anastrepha obliqua]
MGGGDLNLKKSWHPHTMKNQEKVWKAEQAKSQEDKKLKDLRREMEEEKTREELKQIGRNSGILPQEDKKLEWMYKSSTELINREEYLLGRTIDKSFEALQAEEQRKDQNLVGVKQSINHVEHECIPFSIRAYRNMESTEQVDLQRKVMEDPLMLIKQREMESRKKILENPVKLKELHRILKTDEMLKKCKKSKKSKKSKKKHKKRSKSSPESTSNSDSDSATAVDLDKELAKKYKKLNKEEEFSVLSLSKLMDAKFETITKELDKAARSRSRKDRGDRSFSNDRDDSNFRRNQSRHRIRRESETYFDRNGNPQKSRHSRSRSPKNCNASTTRSPAEPRKRQFSSSPSMEKELDKFSENKWNCSNDQKGRSRVQEYKKKERYQNHISSRSKSPQERNRGRYSRSSRSINKDSGGRKRKHSSDHERRPRVTEFKNYEKKQKHKISRSKSPQVHKGQHRSATRSPKDPRRRQRSRSPSKYSRSPQRRQRSRDRNETIRRHAKTVESKSTSSKKKISDAEKEARLREMMENASWREEDRVKSVQKHRESNAREEEKYKSQEFDKEFINKEVKKAIAIQSSVGSRIRSNLNNIQRTSAAMNSNFTKK